MNSLKRIIALCLVFVLAVAAVFALNACKKDPDPVPTPTPDPIPDPTPDPDEETVLELISAGVANFKVVRTSELKSGGVKKAQNLVKELENLGITTTLISDANAQDVTECEIIIGSGAKHRDGCNVDYHTLGKDGYVIKVVGKKVIIAGGTDDALCEAIDVFREEVLGITEDTETLAGATISMNSTDIYDRESEYDLLDIKVGSKNSLAKGYYLSFDAENEDISVAANKIRNAIYNNSGIWLPLEKDLGEGESAKNLFIVREVNDAGEGGFRVYVDNDMNVIMECSFLLHLERGTDAFLNEYINDKSGVSRIYDDEVFEYAINVVRYTEFGAVGDGKTDDFNAILATHQYANAHGIKVVEDEGLTYLMKEDSYGRTIAIATDVDFGSATYIVDDSKLTPDLNRGSARSASLFSVSPSEKCRETRLDASQFEGISLSVGDTNIGMTFDEKKLVSISSKEYNVYIRWGSNENAGSNVHENILVEANGDIDPTTPLTFNYPYLSTVSIRSLDETPITIEGGTFRTIANRLSYEFPEMPNYVMHDQYYYYSRNFNVIRSNVTMRNIKHYIEGEEDHGYPYSGFFSVSNCYNVLVEDCVVTGHRAYIEDRDLDGDGIIQSNEVDKGTTMGSYDLSVGTSINTTFRNIIQSNSITSNFYWGVMGSNYGRNIVYDGCYLSRFDAHCGVYNAKVLNSTIGFAINITGDGDLYIENVTKLVGNSLVSMRSDYGSTWHGNVYIKNVRMEGYSSVSMAESNLKPSYSEFNIFSGSWNDWEFGHDCYVPSYVEIDGFSVGLSGKTATLNIFHHSNFTAASQLSLLNPMGIDPDMAVKLSNIDDSLTVYMAASASTYHNQLFAEGKIQDLSDEKKVKAR